MKTIEKHLVVHKIPFQTTNLTTFHFMGHQLEWREWRAESIQILEQIIMAAAHFVATIYVNRSEILDQLATGCTFKFAYYVTEV